MIVFNPEPENLKRSKKLQKHIKLFKSKPLVVNLDWLLDCMEQGKVLEETQYLVNYE